MAELACAGREGFEVSRLEEGTARSYSIDTIHKVRARMAPGDELFFIIGADAFAEIETWLRWQEVVRAVRFIVVSRPGHLYHVPAGTSVERLDSLELTVSSSQIRRALAAGARPEESRRRFWITSCATVSTPACRCEGGRRSGPLAESAREM